jgi:hypothetical protein
VSSKLVYDFGFQTISDEEYRALDFSRFLRTNFVPYADSSEVVLGVKI